MALKPATYSYQWAKSVVDNLKRKHPRGYEVISEIFQITNRDWANYLAKNDPLFPRLRDLVKRTEVYLEIHGKQYTNDKYVHFLQERLRFFIGIDDSKRLTERLNAIMLQEQVLRKGSGGVYPDGTQPTLPNPEIDDGHIQFWLPFGPE